MNFLNLKMTSFYIWWIQYVVIWVSLGYMYWLGWLHQLWAIDVSKIGFLILILFLLVSTAAGFLAYKTKQSSIQKFHNFIWFSAEAMQYMGMIGTVIGFIIIFGPGFESLDIKNDASIIHFLQTMGSGVGTALVTTLVGLCCSLMTKFQIIIIENYWE